MLDQTEFSTVTSQPPMESEDYKDIPDVPILQGDLYKRGAKPYWKKRFFVLRKNLLLFYQTRHDIIEEPLGVIPLHAATINPVLDSGHASVVQKANQTLLTFSA
jgi:hypothetical protein